MREPAFPDGVVAAFVVPPGWPSPNAQWMIDNQFWSPPAQWTPRRGLEAAPRGWVFWNPKTTEFSKWVAPALRVYTVTAWLAALVVVVAAIAWVVGASSGPSLSLLWPAAAVVSGLCVAGFAIGMRSGRRNTVIHRLGELAPAHRGSRIDAHYDKYLQRLRDGSGGAS